MKIGKYELKNVKHDFFGAKHMVPPEGFLFNHVGASHFYDC